MNRKETLEVCFLNCTLLSLAHSLSQFKYMVYFDYTLKTQFVKIVGCLPCILSCFIPSLILEAPVDKKNYKIILKNGLRRRDKIFKLQEMTVYRKFLEIKEVLLN